MEHIILILSFVLLGVTGALFVMLTCAVFEE